MKTSIDPSHPFYQMALKQLQDTAAVMGLKDEDIERLKWPRRSITVSVPVRMDNGEVKTFLGFRVLHFLSNGPSKGGLRFHPKVDLGEMSALSMYNSWKYSLYGLPFGGAKGGVACDPSKMSIAEIERLSRRYAQEMIAYIGPEMDVMDPDLGTNEQVMAWIMDVYSCNKGYTVPSVVTGKPLEIGGVIGRKKATGRGVSYLIDRVMGQLKIKTNEATAVIQGFGNNGRTIAEAIHERGVKVVGVSDQSIALYNPQGIDITALTAHVEKHTTIKGFADSYAINGNELLLQKCDVLVPAAVENVIKPEMVAKLQCRILAEAANAPTTPEADVLLEKRDDVFVIPDIVSNAGGNIISYFEWVQGLQQYFWTEAEINQRMFERIEQAWTKVCQIADQKKVSQRRAALIVGIGNVMENKAMRNSVA